MRQRARRRWIYLALGLLYLLRLDFWNWRDPGVVLGLPAGFAYHLGLCLAATLVLVLLVRRARPDFLAE